MITTSKHFYDTIKLPKTLFPGSISKSQVAGIEAKITAFNEADVTDLRKVAYMLATSYHETGQTMQPVRENEKGAGHDYGKMLDIGGGLGKRIPYTEPKQIYYGRGDVQLTWRSNYKAFEHLLGIALIENPDLALVPKHSADIMIKGMTVGYFTGKKLSDYFNEQKTDWVNARRIINGTDCAQKIADYAQIFYHGLLY